VSKTFDPTLQELVESYPAAWLRVLGLPVHSPVQVVNADLATITTEADKVIRVGGPSPWLAHLELQVSRDRGLPSRTFRYSVLIFDRHQLPVLSAIVLLRPEADGPELTGHLSYEAIPGRGRVDFRYEVLRVWQEPPERFLNAGPGLIPLAPVAKVTKHDLPEVMEQMKLRLRQSPPEERKKVLMASYIMMGLRYPQALIDQIMKGVEDMEESVTYQAIIRKGEAKGLAKGKMEGAIEEARSILILLGTERWGKPSPTMIRRLARIHNRETLEQLTKQVLHANSWKELLAAAED
jgi:predicted transposase YdaD